MKRVTSLIGLDIIRRGESVVDYRCKAFADQDVCTRIELNAGDLRVP